MASPRRECHTELMYRVMWIFIWYVDKSISTSGYMYRLLGGEICWIEKKQAMVNFSTTKIEYMVVAHAYKVVL